MMENEMSATNSSKESSDELQLSCGKKSKCAVLSNRHDMDSSSMGGRREAAGSGMVVKENHQAVNAIATMRKEKSSATKMKPRLNYNSNIIIRKRKVSEYSTLSTQEKASKSKPKKNAKQSERKKRKTSDSHPAVAAGIDEANMDEGTDMHIMNANDINANASANANANAYGNANAHDTHANAQLSIYQSALAMSETQKSQVVAENQILRQSCAQARIVINDVISPEQVATGEEKAAADLANDITESETEALATIESHSVHAHAHAHRQVLSPHTDGHHHHVQHESMTHNAAGLPSRSEEKWESCFRDLAAYKEQHGNCLVPTSTELGSWLYYQRHNFRYKNLKEERKQRLVELDKTCLGEKIAELGSGTITDKDDDVTSLAGIPALHSSPPVNSKMKNNQEYKSKHDENWNKIFMELEKYKEKNGHCNCPHRIGSLGHWVSTQRNLFTSKKLKADRYEKLVGIGFLFVDARFANFNEGTDNVKWNTRFMELEKYKEKNGHCNCPQRNGSLGKWIIRQRTLFRSKKLNADRYEKLVGIGLIFKDAKFPSNNVKWNTRFIELEKYKEKNGHCNCPQKNGSLGEWIHTQRTLFTSKKLKADRYEKLVGIGFEFEDNVKWNTRFIELEKYKAKNGHCNCPTKNGSLGKWISTQRTLFRSKELKADRYEKLVGIGFA